MFSSDRLKKWLVYAEKRRPPEMIPMSGAEADGNRFVSVRFTVAGEALLFRRIVGDQLVCLALDEEGRTNVERVVGIYDVWDIDPEICEYWGTLQFTFNSWNSFALEQTLRLRRFKHHCRRLSRRLWLRVRSVRKRVAVQRYAVLSTVARLKTSRRGPNAMEVANAILGREWVEERGAFERLDQVEEMLDALVELKELRKNSYSYLITGPGVAALSQYEEEERKHRESIWMQRWIAILTVALLIAALLQARLIEAPTLLKFKGPWPWQ